MLCLSLGQETLNSQLLIVNCQLNDVSPTLQPIRSRFIPRKRLLNGTIGRSSDLSYFASFPIGLPPISGLFAKDTSVVSSFRQQVSQLQDADLQQRVCYGFSPYSLFNQGVTPDTYYSFLKLVAKIVYFGDIHKFISFFFQLLCLLALLFLDLLYTFIEGRSTYSTNEAV